VVILEANARFIPYQLTHSSDARGQTSNLRESRYGSGGRLNESSNVSWMTRNYVRIAGPSTKQADEIA
jgi:hypothetical protein